jgi:3-oxoacyl-[acyl-carrier protein] reductase
MGNRLRSCRGRSVLVTGGASGIGRAIAERAAADGARIALVSLREARLDEAVARMRELGAEAHGIVCDVADRHAAFAAVERAEELFGRVDVAFLNAGVGRHRTFVEHDLDDAEQLLRVNVLGSLYFAHALAPRMLARGEGWLVFTASIGGLLPLPGEAVYCASKFAIVGLAESLSIELEPSVHVLTVCPGMVHTNFLRDDERDRVTAGARRTALEPAEVARATFAALSQGRRRVIVPAKLGVVVGLRGVAPGLVRSGTARDVAPVLDRVRRLPRTSRDVARSQ